MIRINLLPYREIRRAAKIRQFTSALIATGIAGILVVALGSAGLAAKIHVQQQRDDYLKVEITKLDKQIKGIKELKKQAKELIARKQVVETLQEDRPLDVHLLDQLVHLMSEGTYLTSIDQHDDKVHLVGYAQSSARVSTLMRNLDSSPWLHNATLVEVKSVNVQGIQANEFSLDVYLKAP